MKIKVLWSVKNFPKEMFNGSRSVHDYVISIYAAKKRESSENISDGNLNVNFLMSRVNSPESISGLNAKQLLKCHPRYSLETGSQLFFRMGEGGMANENL